MSYGQSTKTAEAHVVGSFIIAAADRLRSADAINERLRRVLDGLRTGPPRPPEPVAGIHDVTHRPLGDSLDQLTHSQSLTFDMLCEIEALIGG